MREASDQGEYPIGEWMRFRSLLGQQLGAGPAAGDRLRSGTHDARRTGVFGVNVTFVFVFGSEGSRKLNETERIVSINLHNYLQFQVSSVFDLSSGEFLTFLRFQTFAKNFSREHKQLQPMLICRSNYKKKKRKHVFSSRTDSYPVSSVIISPQGEYLDPFYDRRRHR